MLPRASAWASGDSAVVTNPTFCGRDQPQRMMKHKPAPDRRWRMLNTFLSIVAIAIAVVAMLRNPDTPAAAESPQPTAVVSAEPQVQDNVDGTLVS